MKKTAIALAATIIFGKLTPIILLALLMIGLCIIIKECVNHAD